MATFAVLPKLELKITLELSEREALALHALWEYGGKAVVAAIKQGISENLAKKHGAEIESFIGSLHMLSGPLAKAEALRKEFYKPKAWCPEERGDLADGV